MLATPHKSILFALVCLALPQGTEAARAQTTVALTTTLHDKASPTEKQLAANLLALLEVEASQNNAMQVVERQQLNLALHELVLSSNKNSNASLALGKLAKADLILTAKILARDDEGAQRAIVRVTEPLTGTIRGATVALVQASSLDETTREIVHFLNDVIDDPASSDISVSVSPFESLGRFDRLRPLERGLRDLVVAQLRRHRGLRVLQRSEMSQLLKEVDLIRGGLIDAESLPSTLPARAAVYHVRGTIDERQVGDEQYLAVDMEFIHADSKRVVSKIGFTSTAKRLTKDLATQLKRAVEALSQQQDFGLAQLAAEPGFDEVNELFDRAISDLYHFWRRKPRDFSHRDFRLPGVKRHRLTYGGRIGIDTAQGVALIRKSVDRLESVLYLQPERRDAKFALAWCYCNHLEGIWQPQRAEQLISNVVGSNRSDALTRESLNLLAEMYFHHEGGRCKPSDRPQAWKHVFTTFQTMPVAYRDYEWSRLIQLLSSELRPQPPNLEQTARVLRFVAPLVEQHGGKRFPVFVHPAVNMAQELSKAENTPRLQAEANALLDRWSTGDFAALRAESLRYLATRAKDPDQAAQLHMQVAEIHRSDESRQGVHRHQASLLAAVASLRKANKAEQALALLDSFTPSRSDSNSLLYGYHGLERGACLEALGRKQEALETYVTYAEIDEGLVNNRDVEERIEELGGVPIDPKREVDVQYVLDSSQKVFPCRHLVTDGRRLFVAKYRSGVMAYSPNEKTWEQLGGPQADVTALASDGHLLWVGTGGQGLWRCDLRSAQWKQWDQANGLPDDAIVDVLANQSRAYISLGKRTAGGVVRVEADDSVSVYQEGGAPRTCLYHLTTDGQQLYGVNKGLYELDLTTGTWHQPLDPRTGRNQFAAFLHYDESGLWGSHYGKEMFLVGAEPETNSRFHQAWFPRGQDKAGYSVAFAAEHNGQLWFCGTPWRRFLSVGCYRMEIETGDFKIFGPRDGFEAMSQCFDGAWLNGELWLATSAGLARVSPRAEE